MKTVSGWTTFVLDNNSTRVVEKVQSRLHSNALSAGFQFVEYKAPNGVRVRLDVDPFYDDPVRNKILHPMGGVAFSFTDMTSGILVLWTNLISSSVRLRVIMSTEDTMGYQKSFHWTKG